MQLDSQSDLEVSRVRFSQLFGSGTGAYLIDSGLLEVGRVDVSQVSVKVQNHLCTRYASELIQERKNFGSSAYVAVRARHITLVSGIFEAFRVHSGQNSHSRQPSRIAQGSTRYKRLLADVPLTRRQIGACRKLCCVIGTGLGRGFFCFFSFF